MQTLRSLAVAVFALFLVSAIAVAADKDKEKPKAGKAKDLIVGKWEATVKGKDDKEVKVTAEFTKDGKVTFTSPRGSQKATYKVTDEKTLELTRKVKDEDRTDKATIKVTKDELEINFKNARQAMKFKRAKKKAE